MGQAYFHLGMKETAVFELFARRLPTARRRQLVDFGMRRAHEADAGLYAARAAYLAGFDATATVEAGHRFAIPLSGTMAHSFIEAHDREEDAFRGFVANQHEGTASYSRVLLWCNVCRGRQRGAAPGTSEESQSRKRG